MDTDRPTLTQLLDFHAPKPSPTTAFVRATRQTSTLQLTRRLAEETARRNRANKTRHGTVVINHP